MSFDPPRGPSGPELQPSLQPGIQPTPPGYGPSDRSHGAQHQQLPYGTQHPDAQPEPSRCYRHTGRPTGRNCTRCGRPACSECLQTAPVGSLCPECIKSGPKPSTRSQVITSTDGMPATYLLMGICVVLFVVSVAQQPEALVRSIATPLHLQLDLYVPSVAEGQVWRLVTSGFMHFGIIHIGFNMFLLFQLGRLLETRIGSIKYTLLYVACLLAGSLGVVIHDLSLDAPQLAAGASGAVFGLMGATAIGEWLRGVNPVSTPIGRLIGLNLIITFVLPGIAIGAHIGGLLGGIVCGYFVCRPRNQAYGAVAQYLVMGVLIVACTVASLYWSDSNLITDLVPGILIPGS